MLCVIRNISIHYESYTNRDVLYKDYMTKITNPCHCSLPIPRWCFTVETGGWIGIGRGIFFRFPSILFLADLAISGKRQWDRKKDHDSTEVHATNIVLKWWALYLASDDNDTAKVTPQNSWVSHKTVNDTAFFKKASHGREVKRLHIYQLCKLCSFQHYFLK